MRIRKFKKFFVFILIISLCVLPIGAFAASPEATLYIDGAFVGTYPSVQDAVDVYNSAPPGTDFVIEVAAGTVSDATGIIQQAGKNLVLRPQAGATVTFTNTISIDGNGLSNDPATLLIEGFVFDFSDPGTPSECIYITKLTANANHTYAHNVTINGCTFTGRYNEVVAVQSIGGAQSGMRNIAIMNSTATDMHSLAQLKAVSGYAFIQNCVLENAAEGINFFGSGADLIIDSCVINASMYAVRSGQNTAGPASATGAVNINNSVLNSSLPGNGTVILRGDSTRNINIIHSNLTNTAGGPVVQNITPANENLYVINIVESNMVGTEEGIGSGITVIDAPNVENGPICLIINGGGSDGVIITILVIIIIALILLLAFFAGCTYNLRRQLLRIAE